MGLDWDPMPRAKPGHEREVAEIVMAFRRTQDKAGFARFSEITELAFETLGAPRVGIDDAADAWLRTKVAPENFDEERAKMRGYYVLALLPECDGFPMYSNHEVSHELDRYSFRAQFLRDVEDELGPELFERAYVHLTVDEHVAYAAALLDTARKFAREHGVEHVDHVDRKQAKTFDEGSDELRAQILFATARWCAYWSSRGHGLSPWF